MLFQVRKVSDTFTERVNSGSRQVLVNLGEAQEAVRANPRNRRHFERVEGGRFQYIGRANCLSQSECLEYWFSGLRQGVST